MVEEWTMVEHWNRDGGTVENLIVEQWNNSQWNRRTSDGETVEHLMLEQWNSDDGTVQHLILQKCNICRRKI